MRTHEERSPSRRPVPMAFLAFVLLASSSATLRAGELTVSWPPAGPSSDTAYRVYVGDRSGEYDRVVDAGSALRATIRDLEDDKIHYLAVKAYDRSGHESPSFSPELACLASPRVEGIEPSSLRPGARVWITLRGANFDAEVQVRSRDPRLRARASVFAGAGRVNVLVEAAARGEASAAGGQEAVAGGQEAAAGGQEAAGGGQEAAAGGQDDPIPVEPAAFTLINPCRKAEGFFESHPEVTDLDGSGRVDAEDVEGVRDAFGSRRGDLSYAPSADLDGDGSVDGRDLARVIARMGTDVHAPSSSASHRP